MNCQISRHKNGKLKEVKAPNGRPSILYKSIRNILPDNIQPDNYVNQAFAQGLIRDFTKDEVALALWSKTYSPEFKAWFKNSQVVDDNGEPLIVFHGTGEKFDAFSIEKASNISGEFGGFHFGTKKAARDRFDAINEKEIFFMGEPYYNENQFNMMPVFLSIQDMAVAEDNFMKGQRGWNGDFNGEFDGMEYRNMIEDKGSTSYVVMMPSQIKSVYNHGAFQLEKDNIYYQMSSSEVNDANPNLDKKITSYLKDLGVDVKYVDSIKDADGNVLNAYGKANTIEKVIELANDGTKIDTLPEEAAHMIFAMLGKDHPIVRQMMNEIPNYSVYEQVKSEYANVYDNEEDFRFEAVGKLIASHIVKKEALPQDQRNFTDNWFGRLLRVLRNFLNQFTFQNVKREMDIFEKFADDILAQRFRPSQMEGFGGESYQMKSLRDIAIRYNMNTSGFMSNQVNPDQIRIDLDRAGLTDVKVSETSTGGYYFTRNGKKENPVKSYYQMKETLPQEQAVQKLLDLQKSISPEKFVDQEGKEWYMKEDGTVIPERVTNIVQDTLFKKNKSKKQIEKIENDPKSVIGRHFGIVLHDLYENNINWLVTNRYDNLVGNPDKAVDTIADTPNGMQPVHKQAIQKASVALMDHISAQQKAIDPDRTATVLTEQTMVGIVNGKETAGTMDIVVVYSDGSISIYDHKFINYKKELIGEKWVVNPEQSVPFYKMRSYEGQIGIYKNMLNKMGITNFRETRILPNNIQFKRQDKKLQPIVRDLETYNYDEPYLMPIPVVKELTGNKHLDNILRTLFKQSDMLDNLARKNYTDKKRLQEINLQQNLTNKAIQMIQVKHDVTPLVESMQNLIRNENRLLKNMNSLSDAKELYRLHEEIRAMSMLQTDILQVIKDKDLKTDVAYAFANLATIKMSIEEKISELLVNENPEAATPQKELSYLKSKFGYLSQIAHPIFEIARKYIKTSTGNINRDVEAIIEEVKVKKDNLEKWAKSNGMSLLDAYRRIINKDNGNLIFTFSSEFYEKRGEAMENEDTEWMQKEYEYTEEGKARFKEDYKIFMDSLKLTVPEGKARDIQENLWLNKNDLSRHIAWTNKWALGKYAQLKDPSKWYSDQYRELMKSSNAPLKEYFDWYTATNRKLNRLVSERIGKSFVANIQRGIIDSVAQGNPIISSVKQGYKDIINGLRVRQNDIMLGEDGNHIPLLFYDNFLFKNKDGEWEVDVQKKSEDLTSNMILFAESVYRKHHMSKIADIMDLMKLHLSNQQTVKTDNFGRPIRNKTNDGWELENTSTNEKTFETLIKALVYGQKMQTKDMYYEIGGKTLSATKTIRSVMSYLSAKALSLNYVSAFGSLAGGYANTYIKAVGGRYFNREQMKNAESMMVSRSEGDKFNHISKYFNVENENWVQREAAKLSASALTRNLNYDNMFILHQKGDEIIGNLVLGSMMQNYGLDENGLPKRLQTLPEGTKSLMELTTVENDKINVEGLSNEAFDEFRNMVKYVSRQIKGSNTKEDLNTLQTSLGGQILLQFRNWISPTIKERFGSLEYTAEVKEWEYGRYRSMVKTMVKDRFIPGMMKVALDLITLGRIKYQADNQLLMEQYDKFIKDNPLMEGKITPEEYLDMRQRTIRETMVEARFISAFIVLLGAMAGDWDDDGKKDYQQWFATRQVYSLMNRAYLELSFYSNPHSINALIKDPIPVLSVVGDIVNLGTNTFDESVDTIMLRTDEEENDKKPKLKYTKKFFIGVKFLDEIIEDYTKDDEKDKK